MTRLLVQIDRAVDCFQLLGCLSNLVEMSSCISSVQNWVVQLLNRLCSLLYLAEAVVGIVVQVDRAVDLLQTLEMLLNHIKAVLSTLRQIHRTRDGSKTLSRTQFISNLPYPSVDANMHVKSLWRHCLDTTVRASSYVVLGNEANNSTSSLRQTHTN